MKTIGVIALVAMLWVAVPAQAQEMIHMNQLTTVEGTITALDIANRMMTLNDGEQFTLPPSFEFTSFPAIGQQVEVFYVQEGGRQVIRSIEIGGVKTGGS